MGFDTLEDIQKAIAREQIGISKGIQKEQRGIQKSIFKTQKAMQKAIARDTRISIAKEGRVPVKADLRKKVYDKYHHKCHWSGCNIKDTSIYGKVLQIHHMDMNNTHTYLSNLELLCPTHHKQRHNVMFRKKYVVQQGFETKVRTRLISKEKNKELNRKKAKQKRANNNLFGIPNFKQPQFRL